MSRRRRASALEAAIGSRLLPEVVNAARDQLLARVAAKAARMLGADVPIPERDPVAEAIVTLDAAAVGLDLDDPRVVNALRDELARRIAALRDG